MVRHSRHAQWGIAPLRAWHLRVHVLGLLIRNAPHSVGLGWGLLVLVVTRALKIPVLLTSARYYTGIVFSTVQNRINTQYFSFCSTDEY